MKVKKAKRDLHTGEKKKKRNREQNDEVEIQATVEDVEVDNEIHVSDTKKEKASVNKKRKNKDKSLVRKRKPKGEEVDLEEQSDEVVDNCHSSAEEIQDFGGHRDLDTGAVTKPCQRKIRKKEKRRIEIPRIKENGTTI
ncbi:uncharacterized protein LOC114181966 [Vigna unguiculata]|uniref:uncharacterized protein LOC114181966 n=1 Tax=Vigna unguiculata TaxID=3917 RepID=UPI0010164F66|nr:uncharacterized protein LOC114181859 isoform X2 [Vigna unguiculata]XP_027924481.1 uncharacterized protein LOC114181966 [Vigna unguiculata]